MQRNKVKVARETRHQSQADLARELGVTRQTVSAIEGNKQEPSLQLGLRIAQALGYPVEQLFPIKDDPTMDTTISQFQSYKDILDYVFGHNTCAVNSKQSRVNNFVGGLCSDRSSADQPFRTNYIERLQRLKSIYESDEHCLTAIRILAQDVAVGTGAGAYAELGAIDFLGRMYKHVIGKPAQLHVDIAANRTFAGPMRRIVNLDGYIQGLPTYFDVKLLQDITYGILTKIIDELSQKYNVHILAEHDYAYDYKTLQERIQDIKAEIETALVSKQTYIKLKCVKELAFRIVWSPGVIVAQGTIDPYKAAMVRHKAIFDDAAQFVRDEPFVLFLVTPPWTNTTLTSFQDMDNTFYRSLSRRVFCQYVGSPEKHPEFGTTFDELSRAISMIVFLKLHDNLGDEKQPIAAHAFSNPNANHRYPSYWRDFFNEQRTAIQQFEWDNY